MTTSKSLLTNGAKVINVEQTYYSPTVVIPPSYENLSSLYCVLSKVDNWDDDNNPPDPTQDQKSLKSFLKNAFVAKQITSNEIVPVIQRVNWTSGTVYDYYRDDINIFEQDENGFLVYNFYVINNYSQVFKCLFNANGAASTYEPTFEPGSYNTNGIYQNLDGYKWKYMYTVDTSLKIKFMDSSWIPVPISQSTPNPLESTEGYGALEVINVINGGNGYDLVNSIVSLVITGDGTGANGYVTVQNGSISDILMTSTGTNYTYANAYIQVSPPSAAANVANIAVIAANTVSPIGGHGYDPVSELGCNHVMISVEFNGSENDYIPTDIIYHQVGILTNPTSRSLTPQFANGAIYKTSTSLIVSGGFGAFTNDEKVYQGASLNDASFVGTVLSFNTSTNELTVINTTGSLTTNAPVFGNSSGTARTLLSYTIPDFVPLSGYLSYIENRSGIQRSADGIEQFKIVLGY